MKVLHIVRHLHKVSGVSEYCLRVCDALMSCGVDVKIVVKNVADPDKIPSEKGVPIVGRDDLANDIDSCDVVHIHNLWTLDLHKAAVMARNMNKPILWSVHGTMSPYTFAKKKWKKLLPWYLYQRNDLVLSSVIHVTSACEEEWVRGFDLGPKIVNIPMGAVVSGNLVSRKHQVKKLLFVGRIAPVKKLENLIKAWAKVDVANWVLTIVGLPDPIEYHNSIEKLIDELKLRNRVEMKGPRFGADLDKEYSEADALALVSETENFGVVVADAMVRGIPVVTTKGTPWKIVQESGAGYWIDNTTNELTRVLRLLVLLSDEERNAMGQRGRKLVIDQFSWPSIAQKMKECYESVISRGLVAEEDPRFGIC